DLRGAVFEWQAARHFRGWAPDARFRARPRSGRRLHSCAREARGARCGFQHRQRARMEHSRGRGEARRGARMPAYRAGCLRPLSRRRHSQLLRRHQPCDERPRLSTENLVRQGTRRARRVARWAGERRPYRGRGARAAQPGAGRMTESPPETVDSDGTSGGHERPVLITGGAGFIGTNLAHRLAGEGRRVLVLDDLSRPGVERNLEWLLEEHPDRVEVEEANVLDARAVRRAIERAAEVYHLAAQVAVTTSLDSPVLDFEVNARGTLNVLEAIRAREDPPPLLYTSTNKVYGALSDIDLMKEGGRYVPQDARV